MSLNKNERQTLYQVANGIKNQHPDWSTHTCLEESFIKCAGMANYNQSLVSMLPEYRANQNASIETLLTKLKP